MPVEEIEDDGRESEDSCVDARQQPRRPAPLKPPQHNAADVTYVLTSRADVSMYAQVNTQARVYEYL